MLSRFLSRLKSRLRAHGHANRRTRTAHHHSPSSPSAGHADVQKGACPPECPLCDKRCILAKPRCKHGEAFVQFMRAYAGEQQTRTL